MGEAAFAPRWYRAQVHREELQMLALSDRKITEARMATEQRTIQGHIKWWNGAKRYGFLTFEEGDALLPLAMLKAAGLESLATGTQCVAVVEQTQRGWVVRQIDKVGPPDVARMGGVPATVKWYSSNLGYGFVIPASHNEEIFVHVSVLKAAGISCLNPGQRVLALITDTDRGRRCVMIEAAPLSLPVNGAGTQFDALGWGVVR